MTSSIVPAAEVPTVGTRLEAMYDLQDTVVKALKESAGPVQASIVRAALPLLEEAADHLYWVIRACEEGDIAATIPTPCDDERRNKQQPKRQSSGKNGAR